MKRVKVPQEYISDTPRMPKSADKSLFVARNVNDISISSLVVQLMLANVASSQTAILASQEGLANSVLPLRDITSTVANMVENQYIGVYT